MDVIFVILPSIRSHCQIDSCVHLWLRVPQAHRAEDMSSRQRRVQLSRRGPGVYDMDVICTIAMIQKNDCFRTTCSILLQEAAKHDNLI